MSTDIQWGNIPRTMAHDDWRNRLRAAMKKEGIGARPLSLKAGLSQSFVRDVLDGSDPSVVKLAAVCRVLGIRLGDLYYGTDRIFQSGRSSRPRPLVRLCRSISGRCGAARRKQPNLPVDAGSAASDDNLHAHRHERRLPLKPPHS